MNTQELKGDNYSVIIQRDKTGNNTVTIKADNNMRKVILLDMSLDNGEIFELHEDFISLIND